MKEYTIKVAGVEHTVQLSDEDAKRHPEAKLKQSENKARTAPNK